MLANAPQIRNSDDDVGSCPEDSDNLENSSMIEKVHELTDLELAMLLCLIAKEHCIIEYDQGSDKPLEQELQLIASSVFGLLSTVIHCNGKTSLEEFSNGIFVDVATGGNRENAEIGHSSDLDQISPNRGTSGLSSPPTSNNPVVSGSEQRDQTITNLVVVTGLAAANEQIQIQILEVRELMTPVSEIGDLTQRGNTDLSSQLLRTRRMFTHTEVHAAPKSFLVIILNCTGDVPLVHHLNDRIFISHYHDQEDGYSNVEEAESASDNDTASIPSIVHHSRTSPLTMAQPLSLFPVQDIKILADVSQRVTITAEVMAYLHNLVVFLRLNRAVAKGVSPTATKQLEQLSRILTVIHGQSFVTPAIIGLAFRKIYRHRVQITTPDFERSVQYGSHPKTIASMLNGVSVDAILENVLHELEVPV